MNEASQMQTLIDNSQWIDIRVDFIKSMAPHNVNWQFQLQVASIINVHMGRTYLMVSDYFAQVMTTNQQDETKPICLCHVPVREMINHKTENWKGHIPHWN